MITLTAIEPLDLFPSISFDFFGNPLSESFEAFEILSGDGFTISDVSSTGFSATLGNRTVVVSGTGFDATAGTSDFGTTGTIDGLLLVEDGQDTHSYTGLALSVADFNALIAQEASGDIDALETFIFSQDMTVIGSDIGDSGAFGSAASADGVFLQLTGNNLIELGDGDDSFNANIGNDTLRGGAGDDNIEGFDGFDRLEGGFGDDNLSGGGQRDELFGGRGNDILSGEQARDVMKGGRGKDTLDGGLGKDIMTGGGEADTFIFLGADVTDEFQNADIIKDYNQAEDILLFLVEDMTTISLGLNGRGEVRIDYDNGSITLRGVTDVNDVTLTQGNLEEFT